MACLDFSAGAHVMMSDIDPGNVGGFMMTLVEYTKERNRVMVSAVLDVMSGTDDLGEVLAARGLTYASVCELIAAHPTAPVAAGDGVD